MDNFSFTHVIMLLSNVMQQLAFFSRSVSDSSPVDRNYFFDEITETLDYLSDYISNLRNS